MSQVIYTGGTFDLLHWGHVSFLASCAKFGEVVVSLNPDEFIAAFKGKPPVMTYDERRKALLGCRWVARVIKNTGGADSKIAINHVKPDVIAIGSDWATRDYYKQMGFTQQWLDEKNIILMYIPYTKLISTTAIKARFNHGT
ncbi:MAG: adenylyltransferase/cytidyltransferase family protein [Bacteroidales bacterium]|jgi:cytidyltransferase-like protein